MPRPPVTSRRPKRRIQEVIDVSASKQPPSSQDSTRATARILVGDGLMAGSIRGTATAGTRPLVALTFRALVQLGEELGGPEAAARFLFDLATETNRPFAVNVPKPNGDSTTMFYAPKAWSREKLLGFVAGFAPELEASFGEVAGIRDGGEL